MATGAMFAAIGIAAATVVGVGVYLKIKKRSAGQGQGQGQDRRLGAGETRAGSAFSIGSIGSAASVGSMQSAASFAYDASTQSVMMGTHSNQRVVAFSESSHG